MNKLLATAVAIGLVGMTGNAWAITDNEANASLPFSFSNPGARALGMGGAFSVLPMTHRRPMRIPPD